MAATAPLNNFLDGGFLLLRRNAETLDLLVLKTWAIGISAILWVVIRDDHTPTPKRTSSVVKIKLLEEPEG